MPLPNNEWVAHFHAQSSDLGVSSSTTATTDHFPQGCLFSPDGSCILTSIGKTLRLYNTADAFSSSTSSSSSLWQTALHCSAAETIRSYEWYPNMQSQDPISCCFVTTSRDQPIQLYDAYTGKVRAVYCPYNALDEIEAPNVAIFHPSHGQTLVAGGFRTDRRIYVFDIHRPGRQAQAIWKLGNTKRSSDGQKGLISALAYSRQHEALLAVGTYAPGSIYLYDIRQPPSQVLVGLSLVGHGKHSVKRKRRFWVTTNSNNNNNNDHHQQQETEEEEWISMAKWQWLVQKTQTGVTQLHFDQDFTLFSASRRSNVVLAWDLRMFRPQESIEESSSTTSNGALQSFSTINTTNQRLGLDYDDESKTLFVGGQDGIVRMYNTQNGHCQGKIHVAKQTTNVKSLSSSSSSDPIISSTSTSSHGDAVNGISYHKMNNGTKWLAITTGERQFPTEQDYDEYLSSSNVIETRPGSLQLYQLQNVSQQEEKDSI